jgi:hypothetical protein
MYTQPTLLPEATFLPAEDAAVNARMSPSQDFPSQTTVPKALSQIRASVEPTEPSLPHCPD